MIRRTDMTHICLNCFLKNPDPLGEGYCKSCGAVLDDLFEGDDFDEDEFPEVQP